MSDLNASIFLALRYLRPRLNAPSLINILSTLGVALGVGLLIIVIAVMTGFTDEFKNKLLNTMAHLHVQAPGGGHLSNPSSVVKAAEGLGFKASPVASRNVLMQCRDRLLPKLMIGIDPSGVDAVIPIGSYLRHGTMALKRNQVLISEQISSETGLWLGDKVLLHSPSKLTKMVEYDAEGGFRPAAGKVYLPSEFEVAGIYSFDKYDFDSAVVFAELDSADELFDIPWGAATAVYVTIPDPMNPESARRALEDALGGGFQVFSWKQINSQFLGVLAVEKTMMYFLLIFVVVVAAFSISVSLITFVMRKIREIGLLKAMGASDLMIAAVFTMKGVVVGLIGTLAGTVFGISAVAWRNDLMFALRRLTGIEIFPRKFYFFSELPAAVKVDDLLVIWALSMVLCVAGSLIPSVAAALIQPAKALKYE